ncbi:MAG: radical SAM family heme chaperone HemW [Endomicrobium sp.]|jgi:oxygen-independent coproporphyrinogen-3 oxidase|nr:radical SAM family heme chaperone HemW [Endomicrobium sp.]
MLGLYIHIPFCKQKCFYCNFFSIRYEEDFADEYIGALIKHSLDFEGRALDSVYIGGGTPSVLSSRQIERLLCCINDKFDLSKLFEFTFELNSDSTTLEKLTILKNYNVNRLSIGLESVDDRLLSLLGRVHDFNNFCNVYDLVRQVGFNNISIDLMYGISHQTLKDWENALRKVLSFNSANLSLYPISIEKDTMFYKRGIVTSEYVQRDMYDFSVEFLEQNGYNHYEISNWARSGKESFHNTNYWRNKEYIAIGAGASGYLNRIRYKNVENIKEYMKLVNKGLNAQFEKEYIDDKLYSFEYIMLGLRLLKEGVSIKHFNNKYYQNVLKKCIDERVLVQDNNVIKFAKGYEFLFNEVVSKFVI